jgi:hypothetical protein
VTELEDEAMTLAQSINRGFNLMVSAYLALVGFAFGIAAASPVENDWGDRADDIGLAVAGLACLVWYLVGRNRIRRSPVPVVLVGLALTVQLLAVALERDDAAAFGDNYIGLALLAPCFVFAVVQYVWNGRRCGAEGDDAQRIAHPRAAVDRPQVGL